MSDIADDSHVKVRTYFACAARPRLGYTRLALVEFRRLRGSTMSGPVSSRIGTVTPANAAVLPAVDAGGTGPAKPPTDVQLNEKPSNVHSR